MEVQKLIMSHLYAETISLPIGNSNENFQMYHSQLNKTITVRLKFVESGSHGNDQVTMDCTLYGTA